MTTTTTTQTKFIWGGELSDKEKRWRRVLSRMDKDPVDLNVGGRSFVTTRSTLTRYPDSLLGYLYGGKHINPFKVPEGGHFIDRNPDYFEVILDFLRTGYLVLRQGLSRAALDRELAFYGLTDVVDPNKVDDSALDKPMPMPQPQPEPLKSQQQQSNHAPPASPPKSSDPVTWFDKPIPRQQPGSEVAQPTTSTPSPQLSQQEQHQQQQQQQQQAASSCDTPCIVQPSMLEDFEYIGTNSFTNAEIDGPDNEEAVQIQDAISERSTSLRGVHDGGEASGTHASGNQEATSAEGAVGGGMVGATPDVAGSSAMQMRRVPMYEASWATSMACRSGPILERAMDAGLLRFTVFVDVHGGIKGVPSQLNGSEVDGQFWGDFAMSVASAPPGSAHDFSDAFREHFDVTQTAGYPGEARLAGRVAVVGGGGGGGNESESLSWVVFRVRAVRGGARPLPTVDRTGDAHRKTDAMSLSLIKGWQLHFNMPESLTASLVRERIESVVNGSVRSHEATTHLYLLN